VGVEGLRHSARFSSACGTSLAMGGGGSIILC